MSLIPRLVGMIHLLPLPGSPRFGGSMIEVTDAAIADSATLIESGFPALIVENFGDAPFYAGSVPPETVASMALMVNAVIEATGVPVGVNVLRNDAISALAVAAATGAAFIRVNVLTGTMDTDQGPIVGDAAGVARARQRLCPHVEVWADVLVKHATPPPGADPGQIAGDTVNRGLADAVIVSGAGTGQTVDPELVRTVAAAVPKGTRVVIGSGATTANLGVAPDAAHTVIVGSALKVDGSPDNRVDRSRAIAMVDSAREAGLI